MASVLRPAVLGGVDGVITSFAIVAGGHGGDLSMRSIIILGVASILADGFSMGISEYLSSTSHVAAVYRDLAVAKPRPGVLGLVCFFSFVVCGAVPILTFWASSGSILACAMFSLAELMALGASRTFISKEDLLFGLVQTALLGTVAGGVAYAAGYTAGVI